MQFILVAFIVVFGVITIQSSYQLSVKLRNLFDSITKNDERKTRTYRNILGKEAAREQQEFDTMKVGLRFARLKNVYDQRNLNNKSSGTAFKRNIHDSKNDAPQQCKEDGSSSGKQNSQNATRAKYTVVMVRHGESSWNKLNLFCGWFDADLSENGTKEAEEAGITLREAGFVFDIAYTSVLMRARDTCYLILKSMRLHNVPVHESWRLNERHYGALTGLNKAETARQYGEDQVRIWRRSYDVPPPPMEKNHTYYGMITHDPRYVYGPEPSEFPFFESLKMTIERTLPYWNEEIVPQIKSGKRVLIVAHGNSLRGIVKHLDNMSEDEIMTLNLPTGIPFLYELDENLKPVTSLKFVGDEETVAKAMATVAAQGKAG